MKKEKLFYLDKTNVAVKRNIMKFRSFHQSSLILGDDFPCSSYPGRMDIISIQAHNHDIMKINGRKIIGSVIGSGDTLSATFDRSTANFSREKMGNSGQDEGVRNVRNAGWVLPMLIIFYEGRGER